MEEVWGGGISKIVRGKSDKKKIELKTNRQPSPKKGGKKKRKSTLGEGNTDLMNAKRKKGGEKGIKKKALLKMAGEKQGGKKDKRSIRKRKSQASCEVGKREKGNQGVNENRGEKGC